MTAKQIFRAADIAAKAHSFAHPWNPNSEATGTQLASAVGMKRLGVNLMRLAPGRESFVPHAHHKEEEWVYVLEGQGHALIGEEEFAIGPGDFIGFPAPQIAHQIRNTGARDLVCLMGGQQLDIDVVDFPKHGKRMVWLNGEAKAYDSDAGENPFAPQTKP